MPFDYKKEYKEFYRPGKKATFIEVPEFAFAAVRGSGDPNEENGAYKKAIELLYSLLYTIKMSKKGEEKLEGYFDFVVPPLEGLWWSVDLFDPSKKEDFNWISMIRLPDFVTEEIFEWAKKKVQEKKKIDTDNVIYFTFSEGPCVQIMHVGEYDKENESISKIDAFIDENNLERDESRYHHEIYLSDPRRAKPENLKTIIRIPVKK